MPDDRPLSPPSPETSFDDRFARLFDRTSQPLVVTQIDGRITHSNRAFQQMLGYTAGELECLSIADITPEEWRDRTRAALEALEETGQAQRYEKQYRHRDGRMIPVVLVTDFDRDENDQVRGYYAFATDITDRKRTEEELRASEQRFRELYDEAPFGYHVIDAEGIIQSVNRTECEMLGYSREEMLYRPIFDFVAEQYREEARRAVAERIRGDRPVQAVEREYRTKDGHALVLHIENRLLRDRTARVIGIRSTVQDITSRKETEGRLIASERRLRALFEGIDDAVFVHDLQGHILDANPAASRKLGYTHDEFLKLNTRDIDDPEFAAQFQARLDLQLRSGHLSCEGRHRMKDGRSIPVDISTSTIQLDNQPAILAVIRDITERKALEATRLQFAEAQAQYAREMEHQAHEIARSELRYRQLAASLLDGLVVFDPDGKITLFNQAAEKTFGHAAAEVLGADITELIPDDLDGAPLASLRIALRESDPRLVGQTIEVQGRRKGGESFPLELSLSEVDAAGAREYVGSIRDLTERHRMRALLMQTDRLASIGLLSAGVAHEINNPLAYIANNLAVLERDVGGMLEMLGAYEAAADTLSRSAPATVEQARRIAEDLDWPYVRANLGRMIARTREGVQRVGAIVANLRGLARTAPPRFEPAFLADLLDTALEMVEPRMRRSNIEVHLERQSLPKIGCVTTQIGQVMLNLIVNAIQAMEVGQRGPRRLDLRIHGTAEQQTFEISDSGPGIPPEAQPRLFDPFYSTKPVGEGTGLGLAISHGIVEGHGGRIEVESKLGSGATFRVTLPTRRDGHVP
jgi:PAS domain S-box-containing protein